MFFKVCRLDLPIFLWNLRPFLRPKGCSEGLSFDRLLLITRIGEGPNHPYNTCLVSGKSRRPTVLIVPIACSWDNVREQPYAPGFDPTHRLFQTVRHTTMQQELNQTYCRTRHRLNRSSKECSQDSTAARVFQRGSLVRSLIHVSQSVSRNLLQASPREAERREGEAGTTTASAFSQSDLRAASRQWCSSVDVQHRTLNHVKKINTY